MLLQMLLRSMHHLHRNKLKTNLSAMQKENRVIGNSSRMGEYPLFSNREMISPTRPRITPSGLTAMNVCSVAISDFPRCDVKSFVIWKASVRVMKEKMKVVNKRTRGWDIHSGHKFSTCQEIVISTKEIVHGPKPRADPTAQRTILHWKA